MKELRRHIRLVGLCLVGLFGLWLLYFCYSTYFYGGRWFANPYNTRISSKKQSVIAGTITDAAGEVLAYTDAQGERRYAQDEATRRAVSHVVGDDGAMMRLPALRRFAKAHGLRLCSVERLIAYRRAHETLVEQVESVDLPTAYGHFRLTMFRGKLDGLEHLALTMGDLGGDPPPLVRVHSECLTGDVFGSARCDCGWQLHQAMTKIAGEGRGCLLYMRQEGRGIGLANKLHAYRLQEQGCDTVEANVRLGFAPDLRDYGIGAQILAALGVRRLRLMTNNPQKVVGLAGHGLEIAERVPLVAHAGPFNAHYLETKREKMGHLL